MRNCYNLISCNPSQYPSINTLCWSQTHPFEGQVVYVNEGVVDVNKTYTLTFVGINTCVCLGVIPRLQLTSQGCTGIGIFKYQNCETGQTIRFGFPVADPVNSALRKSGSCDCWLFVGEDSVIDEVLGTYTEYNSCNECLETREAELCPSAERTVGYAVRVNLPDSPAPDRGFSKCCYTNLALADVSDASEYKNDYVGAYFKRETPSSTVVFKLVDTATSTEYLLNNNTYGIYQNFGGVQADLSYYIVEWRKVLTLLGAGNYQITVTDDFNCTSSKVFSIANANAPTLSSVVTDIDCPYCRKFHNDIPIYIKNGIKVRYLVFTIKTSSKRKIISAWCSNDKNEAFTKLKNEENIPSKTCDNPIEKHQELISSIGVGSTPSIYLPNGRLIQGYMSPDEVIQKIRN